MWTHCATHLLKSGKLHIGMVICVVSGSWCSLHVKYINSVTSSQKKENVQQKARTWMSLAVSNKARMRVVDSDTHTRARHTIYSHAGLPQYVLF
jgi:hypothetical protein